MRNRCTPSLPNSMLARINGIHGTHQIGARAETPQMRHEITSDTTLQIARNINLAYATLRVGISDDSTETYRP